MIAYSHEFLFRDLGIGTHMATIEFTAQEKSVLVEKLKAYFINELDQEIGQFDAEFLLNFMSRELGAYHFY